MQQGFVVEPECQIQRHVVDQSEQLLISSINDVLLQECLTNRIKSSTFQLNQSLETTLDAGIALQDVVEIVVQKTVLIHLLHNDIKIVPIVFRAPTSSA